MEKKEELMSSRQDIVRRIWIYNCKRRHTHIEERKAEQRKNCILKSRHKTVRETDIRHNQLLSENRRRSLGKKISRKKKSSLLMRTLVFGEAINSYSPFTRNLIKNTQCHLHWDNLENCKKLMENIRKNWFEQINDAIE